MRDQTESPARRAPRWIYAVLLLVVVVGLLFPGLVRSTPAIEATNAYMLVEGRTAGRPVFVYYAGLGGDAQRQLVALLRQAIAGGATVVSAASSETAAAELDRALRAELAASRRSYGTAGVNLGFRGGRTAEDYLMALARGFSAAAQGRDHSGADLDLLPLVQSFRRLDEASLWLAVAGGSTAAVGVTYDVSRDYPVPLLIAASGEAAVLAEGLWQEGRIDAVLPGGRPTADYEALVAGGGTASRHVTALTLGMLFMVGLILWAYLSGWIARRRPTRMLGGITL